MECLRPITISVSRLRSEDISRLAADTTNFKISGCTSDDWCTVIAELRKQFRGLTHVHLEDMPIGDQLVEELLMKGGYGLVELHLVRIKPTHRGIQSLANCDLRKLLTLTLSK